MRSVPRLPRGRAVRRRGAATLDYVLVLGAVLPMMAMSLYYSNKIMKLAYEMICVLVSWPLM
jgi:hypothetical protein